MKQADHQLRLFFEVIPLLRDETHDEVIEMMEKEARFKGRDQR